MVISVEDLVTQKFLLKLALQPVGVFSMNCYKPNSIKAQKRLRRGSSDQYTISGSHTSKPSDFRVFLGDEMNKNQLCNLLLKVWANDQVATWVKNYKKTVLCAEGKAVEGPRTGPTSGRTNDVPKSNLR